MAIQWGKQAWDEVSAITIKKCFVKVGLYPDETCTADDDDDPFEGEDMQGLQELCSTLVMAESTNARQFIDAEDEIPSCADLIDDSRPTWREDIRGSILEEVTCDNNDPHTKVSKEPFEISDDDDDGTGED